MLGFGPIARLDIDLNNMLVIRSNDGMKEAMSNDRGASPTWNIVVFGSEAFDEIYFFARGKLSKDAKPHPFNK